MEATVRKLATDAGTLWSRAVQFTEEKLGQAERTELDVHFENLVARAEATRIYTERILKQTEYLLQPNPNARIEDYFFEKIEGKAPPRMTNLECLGHDMVQAGREFGPGTPYGSALISAGEIEKAMGAIEREFVQNTAHAFLVPLGNFLNGDCKTIAKERKLLESKRLDLDTCKSRLRKAHVAEIRTMAELDVHKAETEFERQAEITRLLMEGISSTHVNHHRCLKDFVDSQTTYFAKCYQHMLQLQKELGSSSTSQATKDTTMPDLSHLALSSAMPTGPAVLGLDSPMSVSPGTCARRARVLYDYDAADVSELSLLADEVIMVYSLPGMDYDWLMAEKAGQRGKVPVTYLELLN
uniref:endophilin-B1-like n=1 Tax=Myxine glutinosa TaxID=7769 RepID=UPI00358E85E3